MENIKNASYTSITFNAPNTIFSNFIISNFIFVFSTEYYNLKFHFSIKITEGHGGTEGVKGTSTDRQFANIL